MGLLGQILNSLKISKVENYTSANTTTITGSTVDMKGFDSCVFAVVFGTYHATNNYIKVQQGDESDASDAADLEGSKLVSESNNGIVAVEIYKPLKRYLTPLFVRGTSSTLENAYALQSGGHVLPEDNNVASAITSEILITPDEGTA